MTMDKMVGLPLMALRVPLCQRCIRAKDLPREYLGKNNLYTLPVEFFIKTATKWVFNGKLSPKLPGTANGFNQFHTLLLFSPLLNSGPYTII